MFFRFIVTLAILTSISLLGIGLEKQNLAIIREISAQHYELQELQEQRTQLFLKTQQLGAPQRLHQQWNSAEVEHQPRNPEAHFNAPPLLEWRLQGTQPRVGQRPESKQER